MPELQRRASTAERSRHALLVVTVMAVVTMALMGAPAVSYAQGGGLWAFYSSEAPDGGPPSGVVHDLLPRENGLWVAADEGLGYYDGHRWSSAEEVSKDKDDAGRKGALRGLGIVSLVLVTDTVTGPSLWVATPGGIVVRPDGAGWAPSPLNDQLTGKAITVFLQARDGDVWIGTQEGLVRRRPDGTLEEVATPGPTSNAISALAEDDAGGIWAGTEGDGLFRYAGGAWRLLHRKRISESGYDLRARPAGR